jgi:spore coat polysaccharide biosynthesis protein SpsF
MKNILKKGISKKNKFGLFITARVDSSRLPNKMLLSIRGKSVIEHDIERAKLTKEPDMVVLCTTKRHIDDELVKIADRHGISHYRGLLSDKLGRWLGACETFGLNYFVEFDGDDLFCDPELVDSSIRQMRKEPCDVIKFPSTLVCGGFTYCFSALALRKACEIKDTDETDTVFWNYFTETNLFNIRDLKVKEPILHNDSVRLTLDYPEDLDFFRCIFNKLNLDTNNMSLRDIMAMINNHPELAKINFFRQNDFLENQKNKTKLIIKNFI